MRISIGLLFMPALAFGACADDVDTFIPQMPSEPGAVVSNEPIERVLVDTSQQLERPDTAIIDGAATVDRAYLFGRQSRALYDRMHAAGLVR